MREPIKFWNVWFFQRFGDLERGMFFNLRNVVQLSGNAPQQPSVISDCVMHHAAANDKDCSAVHDSIANDRWLLSSIA